MTSKFQVGTTSAVPASTYFENIKTSKKLIFKSRRSPVLGTRGMVSSSQPLASEAGMRVLQQGGNAADAAVAMAAALNVTEPCSTGLGGDAFVLYYDASKHKVNCILGSGKSPAALRLDLVRARGHTERLPLFDALTVTVPGAAGAWTTLSQNFGRLPLASVLAPAIELAENGFPVSPLTAHHWEKGAPQLLQGGPHAGDLLLNGKAPRAGELFKNVHLANVLRRLGKSGAEGFYSGPVARAVVEAVKGAGGVITEEDMRAHQTSIQEPISTTYRGLRVWEVPPPTQGITALMALNILQASACPSYTPNQESPQVSPAQLHFRVESMRLAFADALQYVADDQVSDVATRALLSKSYAAERAACINPRRASEVEAGRPVESSGGGDTVYFCAVDKDGNGCSMINSNYMGFGTGIVPAVCGFSLQNRGHNFSLDPAHPNCLAPLKRPYHTIIPGLCTFEGKEEGAGAGGGLAMCFGVMGAFMQPQGHMQVLSNMLDLGMDPQAALDAPRFKVDGVGDSASPADVATSQVSLEEGFSADVVDEFEAFGHNVRWPVANHERELFGRGQIIARDPTTGVLWGGSDPRADGLAMGW
uniref:Gamma-glutamyltransferase n=1 Tax=Polyblepharides amylifera TaxID=1486889 RepID=A0A7R9XNL0_9CHLO|mmetsp:Transcript_98/g.139  ORF Transcript_98/g.139 Transcript_98/m.139 type:complete len:590 (+) Transcript_98:45-1814(+)|eukprot:CAMPEP_0196594062 /NCGR_PEP_ID=MMETSP1081-20130531/77276_1 /TAXON_ID=36882 /ORGANISM="Pyramimonas amylifera, Strain CCMP720" /LENGTH=589 /DNA_ID=CAMNT_0041918221 /DNA_START=43 /DNA_END=1812 /DNA_ORIENTATION=+